jgi:hypothetical protein
LIWLHDAAEFRDEHKRMQESKTKGKQGGKKPQQFLQYEEVDYNESSFGGPKSYKDIQKDKKK